MEMMKKKKKIPENVRLNDKAMHWTTPNFCICKVGGLHEAGFVVGRQNTTFE